MNKRNEKEHKRYLSVDAFSVSLLTENAVVPSKRPEDAGWDIYADVKKGQAFDIPVRTPTKIPTGLAMAFNHNFCFNMGTGRSSIAKYGIRSLGGLVDSGYRGEVFVNLFSEKEARIYYCEDEGKKIEVKGNKVYIPSNRAIVQGLFQYVPKLSAEVEPYEELKKYESFRGAGALGSSGK